MENIRVEDVKVDLNTGTQAELEKLTGIGPKMARAIVKYRGDHGGFKTPDEVLLVPGFGPSKFEKLRENLAVNGKTAASPSEQQGYTASEKKSAKSRAANKSTVAAPTALNLNKATVAQLSALPVIGKKLAREIVSYRAQHPPFKEKTELLKVKGVSVTIYNKIEQYLTLK